MGSKKTGLAIVILSFLVFSGCAAIGKFNQSNDKHVAMTGLCGNDLKKMEAAFEAVKKGMTPEEVASTCLDPSNPRAKNVDKYPGASGVKYMYGTDQLRPNITDPSEYKAHIEELDRYNTWVFKYTRVNVKKNSNFLSNKESAVKSGVEKLFVIVFYDGKVLSKSDPQANPNESKEKTSSVLKGITGFLLDIGKMGGKFGR